jgi:hypothetical protein
MIIFIANFPGTVIESEVLPRIGETISLWQDTRVVDYVVAKVRYNTSSVAGITNGIVSVTLSVIPWVIQEAFCTECGALAAINSLCSFGCSQDGMSYAQRIDNKTLKWAIYKLEVVRNNKC